MNNHFGDGVGAAILSIVVLAAVTGFSFLIGYANGDSAGAVRVKAQFQQELVAKGYAEYHIREGTKLIEWRYKDEDNSGT